MTGQTCNGWANAETRIVNLWLTNDQSLYEEAREFVEQWDATAWKLKEWVLELDGMTGATNGLAVDLISCALDRVNWGEILESLRAE